MADAAEAPTEAQLSKLFERLNHQFQVVRREAIADLVKFASKSSEMRQDLQARTLQMIEDESKEKRQAGFLLAKEILHESHDFCDTMLQKARETFTDPESMVREAVAEMMEQLAKEKGLEVYTSVKEQLFRLIDENFKDEEAPEDGSLVVEASIEREKRVLEAKLKGIKAGSIDSWKMLFTCFKTVEKIVFGLGSRFEPCMDDEFFQMVHRCGKHINRFVRAGAYQMFGGMILSLSKDSFDKFGNRIATELRIGLGDNWSQVRHASSVSTRHFFEQAPNGKLYYPILLPPMCLNRYYVAAGVRVYSQKTWELVFGDKGQQLVGEFAKEVTDYYLQQAKADNHAVREAACHCIRELGNKVHAESLRDYIPQLLDTLIGCFKDESWPVRDTACLALGNFVTKFPEESEKDLEELFDLWFEHLSDNIPSVRQDTAVALGNILKHDESVLERYLPKVTAFFSMIHSQSNDAQRYGGLENVTLFGVAAKRKRDNDPELHMDQQQYSCGSLAPKMKKAARCGCMDGGFARDREPWEFTDGAIHLAAEIVQVKPEYGPEYFNQLSEIAMVRTFAYFNKLQETIWTVVPKMGKAMGAYEFKHALEESMLLKPMVFCVENGTMLSKATAGQCLTFCYRTIGEREFDAILSPSDKRTVHESSHVQREPIADMDKYGGFTPGYIEALNSSHAKQYFVA